MNKTFKVDIGGELRELKFNNFAHIEIANVIFKDSPMTSNPSEVVDKLYEIAEKNVMLLIKVLVYAGIIGNDYEKGFDSDITPEKVGKWMATADLAKMIGVWDVFLSAMGYNIPKELFEESSEGEGVEKKS